MKQTKQQLYERIMKKIAPIVKQAINEKFSRVNEQAVKRGGRKSLLYRSRLNESKTLTSDEFYDISYDVYNNWIDANGDQITNEVAQELEKQGEISPDMDSDELFDIIFDKVEDKFGELLDQAVGGDWHEVGLQSGLDDYDLECLYVDDMQAKCNCVTDFIIGYAEDDEDDD